MSDFATEQEYWADVTRIAEDVYEREVAGDDRHDVIHEEVDSSQWVIYTARAMRVLQYSSNDDAIFEEMGSDAMNGVNAMSEVYTRAAYYALARDVNDYIDNNEDELREKFGPKDEDEDEDEDAA